MALSLISKIPVVDGAYLSGEGSGSPEVNTQAFPVFVKCVALICRLGKRISFGGHNKIIKMQTFDFAGAPADCYLSPLRYNRGMVAFLLGQGADFIGKG
jgi:hypothetical protein